MREVLRTAFVTAVGGNWLDQLSRKVREGVRKAAETALVHRPGEVLRDDWDAAGLSELAAAIRSNWTDLGPLLTSAWASPDECEVDLRRLRAYRGKKLHEVGRPQLQIREDEMVGLVLRLRLSFEAVRRELASDQGEWWPYIEAISSNVDEFCVDRSNRHRGSPTLNEGDLVTVEIAAVNPLGAQEDLRYRLLVMWNGGGHDSELRADPSFQVVVPHTRAASLHPIVVSVDDPLNRDEWVLQFAIRPLATTAESSSAVIP
jgi:hypothetical protein